MNNNLKKKLSLLLSAVMIFTMFSIAPFAFGDDLVAINSTNFPDNNFRRLIDETYNTNGDDYLSASERAATEMELSGLVRRADWITDKYNAINDIKGIEYFTNIETLHCGGIGLDSITPRSLPNLKWLNCSGNDLKTLDTMGCSKLQFLNCAANVLTDLRLPYSSNLTEIYCQTNLLTTLTLDGVFNLHTLRCDDNELTQLSLAASPNISVLNCSNNHLASIDLSRTAVTTATDYELGTQTIDVEAHLDGGAIIIPFADKGLTTSNYKGSDLDLYDDGSGFQYDQFVAYDVNNIKNGITYECYPMLDNAENMTVTLNIIRDFYQVDFYTDSSFTEKIGKSLVNSGGAATAPKIAQYPQCKIFDRWSSDITNVTEDKEVYIVWEDAHDYNYVVLADDHDTITVKCSYNDSTYTVSFISVVNTKEGDERFDKNIDVVKDGYINAKDFAALLKASNDKDPADNDIPWGQ